jgi:hypothetical protein
VPSSTSRGQTSSGSRPCPSNLSLFCHALHVSRAAQPSKPVLHKAKLTTPRPWSPRASSTGIGNCSGQVQQAATTPKSWLPAGGGRGWCHAWTTNERTRMDQQAEQPIADQFSTDSALNFRRTVQKSVHALQLHLHRGRGNSEAELLRPIPTPRSRNSYSFLLARDDPRKSRTPMHATHIRNLGPKT